MTYLVMECHPSYAIVLDNEGRMIKAANLGYQEGQVVGEIIARQAPKAPILFRLAPLAAAACLCLAVLGGGAYGAYGMPYGTVEVRINPDVKMSVSYMDRVVGLEGDTLAACLEDYFMRSEQLPTRLFIRTGDVDGKPAAGGMLLQVMPAQNAQQDDFDHLATLTETIKTEELLTLPANEVLWRLYHEEEVTVYDPQDVEFKCTCSRERCADALKTLPDEEVDSILAEDGEIDMHCDYCGNHYLFNAMDIAEIRNNASPADPQVH